MITLDELVDREHAVAVQVERLERGQQLFFLVLRHVQVRHVRHYRVPETALALKSISAYLEVRQVLDYVLVQRSPVVVVRYPWV